MTQDKQIKEMARNLYLNYDMPFEFAKGLSEFLNGEGYRKASEIADEIIEIAKSGAEKYINDVTLNEGIRNMLSIMLEDFIAELKKKYTEEK